jgi:hypothetical protein
LTKPTPAPPSSSFILLREKPDGMGFLKIILDGRESDLDFFDPT